MVSTLCRNLPGSYASPSDQSLPKQARRVESNEVRVDGPHQRSGATNEPGVALTGRADGLHRDGEVEDGSRVAAVHHHQHAHALGQRHRQRLRGRPPSFSVAGMRRWKRAAVSKPPPWQSSHLQDLVVGDEPLLLVVERHDGLVEPVELLALATRHVDAVPGVRDDDEVPCGGSRAETRCVGGRACSGTREVRSAGGQNPGQRAPGCAVAAHVAKARRMLARVGITVVEPGVSVMSWMSLLRAPWSVVPVLSSA